MTRERTDLAALRELCEEALQLQTFEEAEQEAEDETLVVDRAGRWAAAVLGGRAAAALGPWVAIDVTPEGTLQAQVEIVPRVNLVYTVGLDGDGEWLQLVAACRVCQHVREPRITSLLGLTQALHRQGLR